MTFLVGIAGFIVFMLVPTEAHAWGPATHLRFASEVLVNLQMLEPALRTLLAAYPYDYLYGNLAADLILGKKHIDYRLHCHNWDVAFDVLEKAPADPQKAFMWGYISHLSADTIAHNIFIPSQVLRDDAPRGFKHAYWEVRYDSKAEHHVWNLAGKIQKYVDPRNDDLLVMQLDETILPHRVNKVIFNSMLFMNNFDQWRKAVDTINDRSSWKFHPDDTYRYDHLVMNSIFDMLRHKKDSHTYHNDPTGQRMQDLAVRLHKEGRRLRKKPDYDKEMHFKELAPILEFDFPVKHYTELYPDRHPGAGGAMLKALEPSFLREQLNNPRDYAPGYINFLQEGNFLHTVGGNK